MKLDLRNHLEVSPNENITNLSTEPTATRYPDERNSIDENNLISQRNELNSDYDDEDQDLEGDEDLEHLDDENSIVEEANSEDEEDDLDLNDPAEKFKRITQKNEQNLNKVPEDADQAIRNAFSCKITKKKAAAIEKRIVAFGSTVNKGNQVEKTPAEKHEEKQKLYK